MPSGVSLEDITRAADALLAKGERPTVDGVRTFLGTGSPATVNNLLKDYYRALPTRLNLPAPIALAAAELYQKVREVAQAEVDDVERELRQSVELEKSRLAEDRTVFERDREHLNAKLASTSAELSTIRQRGDELERQNAGLQNLVANKSSEVSAAEARARSADEERERAGVRHQEEVRNLRDRADGNERRLLSQIDDMRTQISRLTSERERDQAASQRRIAELEKTNATAAAEAVTQRKAAEKLVSDLEALRQALKDEVARHEAETRLSEQAAKQSARELTQVNDRAEKAEASRSALQSERDAAVQIQARLQGQVEALERTRLTVATELPKKNPERT